tara:strand:+ start:328 stop:498 length:171 start_codon:yes stop_codon:yes gene_type:complete
MDNNQDKKENINGKTCDELEELLINCLNSDIKCEDIIDEKILKKCYDGSEKINKNK